MTTGPLDITFTAVLGKVREGDTWTCVQLPDAAAVFGTRGLVKVEGTVDAEVTAAMRKTIGKTDGDAVTVHLTQRLS